MPNEEKISDVSIHDLQDGYSFSALELPELTEKGVEEVELRFNLVDDTHQTARVLVMEGVEFDPDSRHIFFPFQVPEDTTGYTIGGVDLHPGVAYALSLMANRARTRGEDGYVYPFTLLEITD